MGTHSVYDIKIDNSLSFTPGPTAGYVLSINSDGTTSWVESTGGGGGYDINSSVRVRFTSLTDTGDFQSPTTGLIGSPIGSTIIDFTDPTLTISIGFNGAVNIIVVDSDGKIYIGGEFTSYSGYSANRIIRLNPDFTPDTDFVYGTGFNNYVTSIVIDSNGKIYVGGNFTTYNGTAANKIIRLNPDGSVDTDFVYGSGFTSFQYVSSITIDSNGKIYVSGNFNIYNGTSANRIIRLNPDGSIDTDFVYGTGSNSAVFAISIDSNGKIYLGGSITEYNGTAVSKIVRLNPDGSIDTDFVYGSGFSGNPFLSRVNSISIDSNGKIYAGGNFESYNGTAANRIIRLNPDGSVDTDFVYGSGFNNIVLKTSIDSNGKIYIGGDFTSYKGTSANRIIRLNPDGSIDTDFVYGTGFNSSVREIFTYSGGLFAGGAFT